MTLGALTLRAYTSAGGWPTLRANWRSRPCVSVISLTGRRTDKLRVFRPPATLAHLTLVGRGLRLALADSQPGPLR